MTMNLPNYQTVSEWQDWAIRVVSDVGTLNEMLNDAATNHDICSEYEAVLDEFNSRPGRTFLMDGRARTYMTTLEIRVQVTAKDENAADTIFEKVGTSYVSNMGDEWVRRAAGVDVSFETSDYSVGPVEVED